jgi:glycosyltransferase involved in cell wall biosynthesis
VSAARLAVRRAQLIFAMSPQDVPQITRLRGTSFAEQRVLLLPPAVDTSRFQVRGASRSACRSDLARRVPASDGPLCLCVAMMRVADKLASYRLLAAALARLAAAEPARPWRLVIVGDGPARPAVEAAMASLPAGRVCFAGALEPEALPPLYLGADLFAFPGLGEDFGMVYLEAAAAGLPVVACRGPGPDFAVAPDGGILTEPTPEAFAEGLCRLLGNPEERQRKGETARRFVTSERSLDAFRERLREGLARLGEP